MPSTQTTASLIVTMFAIAAAVAGAALEPQVFYYRDTCQFPLPCATSFNIPPGTGFAFGGDSTNYTLQAGLGDVSRFEYDTLWEFSYTEYNKSSPSDIYPNNEVASGSLTFNGTGCVEYTPAELGGRTRLSLICLRPSFPGEPERNCSGILTYDPKDENCPFSPTPPSPATPSSSRSTWSSTVSLVFAMLPFCLFL
jgi:hypothetical protein